MEKNSIMDRPAMQVILFLPMIVFMNGDLAILLANKLAIEVDLGVVTTSAVDNVIALQYLVQGVAVFIFGYLSDKYSRKRLLTVGGFLWALGCILTAYATNIYTFALFRFVAVIGLASSAPVSFSLLSDIFPSEKRSNSFAWWSVALMIGGLFGGGLGLTYNKIPYQVLDEEFGADTLGKLLAIRDRYAVEAALWYKPYILMGIIALVCLGLVLLVKEPKRAATEKVLKDVLSNEEVDYSNNYQIKKEDLKFIITRKSNIFLVLNFFDVIASALITTYLITYLTIEIGFSIDLSQGIDLKLIMLGVSLIIALGIAMWGQFYFSKKGDKALENGDSKGRIKIVILAALIQIPPLAMGFWMSPSVNNQTFFKGALHIESAGLFWTLFVVMFLFIGLGLAASFGGTPNWYASLIDGNLPEHRGTMISVASLADTVGRSIGVAVGGAICTYLINRNVLAPYGTTMLYMVTIFGLISGLMCLPLMKTWDKDYGYNQKILNERAQELKEKIEKMQERSSDESETIKNPEQ